MFVVLILLLLLLVVMMALFRFIFLGKFTSAIYMSVRASLVIIIIAICRRLTFVSCLRPLAATSIDTLFTSPWCLFFSRSQFVLFVSDGKLCIINLRKHIISICNSFFFFFCVYFSIEYYLVVCLRASLCIRGVLRVCVRVCVRLWLGVIQRNSKTIFGHPKILFLNPSQFTCTAIELNENS